MPTLRIPETANHFVRDWWPASWKRAPLRMRLLSRELFRDGGLTSAEPDLLHRIANGDQAAAESVGPGAPLDPELARRALDFAWLR